MKPIRDLTAADRAVVHILRRIAEDPNTRWSLGWGTESFRLLCLAYADLMGDSFDAVESELRRNQASGKSDAETLKELREAGVIS